MNINDLQTPGAGQLLILAPGERADVVVDFANATQGSFYYLSNHATENSPLGNAGDRSLDQDPLVTLAMEAALRFEVKGGGKKARPLTSDRLTKEIKKLNPVANNPNLKPLRAAARPYDRAYVLTETAAAYQADDITWQRNAAKNPNFLSPAGRFGWKAITFEPDVRVNATGVGSLFGGQVLGGVAALTATQGVGDQASAMPRGGPGLDTQDTVPASQHQLNPGRVELWEIYNTTADVHPIHLHLTQFQVLERQTLDLTASTTDATAWPVAQVAAQSLFGPDANEMGWKDTVRVNPNQVTRLLVRFDDANDQCHTYSGNFVWHCHILEHEDMGMMRPLKIY